ncbi:RNA dependent RNA polymerase-domain-containing protein [Fennellomyces sp. T-0311]|nr:RNA dependent RNA polymerase-domain-containing protein [Fennellomyces sp. T-0311]
MAHSFELFFTLESFISYYRLHELVIPGEFYNLLCKIPPEAAVDALRILYTREECRIWQPLPSLKKIWNERFNLALGHRPRPQPHFAYIYKVLVTPTTIHFELPQLELSNRVIRRFWDHADRFLRVQFVEEGDTPLYLQDRNGPFGMGRVCQRIRDTLRHGIRIGDRYYEFLGFSASQLRNSGCWFFSSTKDLNVEDIRRWMGDFSQETVVARYAARMGQCFSTTQPVFAVQSDQIKSLKDIVRNDHTFSDGIGRISQDLADQIAEVMGRKDKPTAFQFRLGGAKGVLAVHRRIKPNTIVLRPSQMKFSTKHKVLEINTAASYAIAMLNVDMVSVVNSLEVPGEAFMEILSEMVNSVNDMMTDGDKARAVLRASMDGLGNNRDLARIVEAGFFERGDPFIKNALTAFRAHRLKEARERTRIPVIKGASVLGVLDETETLGENEVFLRYIDSYGKAQVVEGDVMVFRSPTLHPGDIRMCKAVDCPKLKHLRNVLAFSSKGERDIPSMCGGGDLDGDWFTVIWDERLFPPHFCRNQPPMDYPKMRGKELSKVTIEDVQAFFVEYMLNDQIKQISAAHRAIADGSPKGVSDKNCLELARAHSIAVDYAKTGCPANVDLELLRVNSYPDFMQKKGKPSWKSEKAIGLIYHKIDPKDYLNYREDLSNPIIDKYYDPRIQAPNMERYIGAARLLKQYYDRQIREKMTMNGITTEAELVTGFVIDWLHKDKSKKMYEALNDIRKEMVRFRNDWRLAEFPDDMPREELEAKAAAWYYVAYHPLEQERQVQEAKKFDNWYQGGCGLISFPWIPHEILCDLAEKNTTEEMESSKYPTFDEATIRLYKPHGIPSPHPYKSREEYDVRNDDGYAVSVVPEHGPRKWF